MHCAPVDLGGLTAQAIEAMAAGFDDADPQEIPAQRDATRRDDGGAGPRRDIFRDDTTISSK